MKKPFPEPVKEPIKKIDVRMKKPFPEPVKEPPRKIVVRMKKPVEPVKEPPRKIVVRMKNSDLTIKETPKDIKITTEKVPEPSPETGYEPIPEPMITARDKAFKGQTITYELKVIDSKKPEYLLHTYYIPLQEILEKHLQDSKGLKFFLSMTNEFEAKKIKPSIEDPKKMETERVYHTGYFNSNAKTVTNKNDIFIGLQIAIDEILKRSTKVVGSFWILRAIKAVYLNIVNYRPLKANSYIPLPAELRNPMKGLINIQNKDNQCFRWCHIRHLNPQQKDSQRIKISDREYVEKLDYSGITFPVDVSQINKIEKQNQININVFSYESGVYPLYISKENYDNHMELLLISDETKKHYVLIKDFNRLMYNQTKHKNKKNFCKHCLQCFSSEEILKYHNENCMSINGNQAVKMPDVKNNLLKFTNYFKQQAVPFVIYADFEALTEKINGCTPSNQKSFTVAYQKHLDCGYGYKLVCCYDDKFSKPIRIYRGKEAVSKFLEDMLEEVKYCKKYVNKGFVKELLMTAQNRDDYDKEKKCNICLQEYTKDSKKVRYHNIVTGEYIGSAHEECREKMKIKPENFKIPVIFHNLKGYDSHFIMQEIGKIANKHAYFDKSGKKTPLSINCIPNNMEKYMAFMLGSHLNFIDSFQFMSSSLESLVSNLQKEAFKYTSEEFKNEELELMTRKGVYPYDWMDSFEKFDYQLPSKNDFYSQLYDQHISDEDYKHVQKVWETFNMSNMGDYHDTYLKSDVLLLADVFENFRRTCLEYYKLDPCHYYTSPGLSWDALLKMSDVKLELLTDIDMHQFIEKGTRGGFCYIAN